MWPAVGKLRRHGLSGRLVTMTMLHIADLTAAENEQRVIRDAAATAWENEAVRAYLDNLGVCADCLVGLAIQTRDERIADGIRADADPGSVIALLYIEAFTLGLVLGRRHPA